MTRVHPTPTAQPDGTWFAPSSSGGTGHTVATRTAKDGSEYLVCTCPGGRFAFAGRTDETKGRGCWAMRAVREHREAQAAH